MNLAALEGCWALITGASSGIGLEFAQQLAKRGLHVVLVARNLERLTAVTIDLQSRCGTRAVPLTMDLGQPDAAVRLREQLLAQEIRPRLLINNAGLGRWGRFADSGLSVHREIAMVNAVSAMELCHTFLPDLADHGAGAVVNLSSPAAMQPVPYMATYAASKAFIHSFSLALHEEWRGRGVYVQTLMPGPTSTEFDDRAGAYASGLGAKRALPSRAVSAALQAFPTEAPLVVTATGTISQRLFAGLAPTKLMLRKVGAMFRPPAA